MKSDVCLILEGTWPYVAGGVSTWVAQIFDHMPQLRFSVLFIGASQDMPRTAKYPIPPNVVEIREIFVHDYPGAGVRLSPESKLGPDEWDVVGRFCEDVARGRPARIEEVCPVVEKLKDEREFMDTLTQSRESWEMTRRQYEELAPADTSFMDFFWTHRFINVPALKLLRSPLPRARVYHAACTGYAGLMAAKAFATLNAPVILTEHGIYTRERRIEIFNADWIEDPTLDAFLNVERLESYFKSWWTNFFLALGRTTYDASTAITTLFGMNQDIQERDGASREKTGIIPNGIDTNAFRAIQPRRRSREEPLNVGFVGRVSAIKDVKTLLRAFNILKNRGVPFEGWIMGPMEEEEDYAEECREMTTTLGLDRMVHYTGRVNVKEYYGKMDVVVLTSISEGQPFVILEAQCAGLPIVSTDVGACSELLYGRTVEDKALGRSGIITPVATPQATAEALRFMAENPEEAAEMGETGRRRALAYYDIRDVMNQYLDLYETYLYAGQLTRKAEG